MAETPQRIAQNLAVVRERIATACHAAGRAAEEVRLVGVTKYVDAAVTQQLLAAGLKDLAESRPQNLWEKAQAVPDANWHLVGHLQRNKVRRTLPLAALLHSADSERLLGAIDAAAAQLGLTARVLLEVKTSGESEKHGLRVEQVREWLPRLKPLGHVRICGLMTMAHRTGGSRVARENFATLRALRDELQPLVLPHTCLDELSMGMSHDLEEGILEGATIVRVGSALFEGLLPDDR